MAYYRETDQVGWVDPDTLELYDLGVSDGEGLVPTFAAVGEWVDDGLDCRFCGLYLGYGSSYTIDGKTACSTCHYNSDRELPASLRQCAMCPHCGELFPKNGDLIPVHDYENGAVCAGTGQIPRNPESDGRPLWNGRTNPHFYRNKKD